jgi:hypothetical protein
MLDECVPECVPIVGRGGDWTIPASASRVPVLIRDADTLGSREVRVRPASASRRSIEAGRGPTPSATMPHRLALPKPNAITDFP